MENSKCFRVREITFQREAENTYICINAYERIYTQSHINKTKNELACVLFLCTGDTNGQE